jgi:hypothetical protein
MLYNRTVATFIGIVRNTLPYYVLKNTENLVLTVVVKFGLKGLMKFCYELNYVLLIVKRRLIRDA